MLHGCLRGCDTESLRGRLGSSWTIITEVFPDLFGATVSQDTKRADDVESGRIRFFEAVAELLRETASSRTVLLVFEDLQWMDAPSLALLYYVAREVRQARLMMIGTYRDGTPQRGEPLWHALGELSREQLYERIVLRGLDEGEGDRERHGGTAGDTGGDRDAVGSPG